MLIQGRLYITENYLCFNSSLLGLNEKIKIAISGITKIEKKKALVIFNNAISVEYEDDGQKTIEFFNFQHRDITYDMVYSLWKVLSPHAGGGQDDSENDDEESF